MSNRASRRHLVATFSIVAVDLATGGLGIAVASKFLACGAVVPWASAGAGAVATQSFANTAYGPDGLRMMRDGLSAREALARLIADDADLDLRVNDRAEPMTKPRRLLDPRDLPFGISPASEKLTIDGAALLDRKRIMKRTGRYRGEESAQCDEATTKTLDAFTGSENIEKRVDRKARTFDASAMAYLGRVSWSQLRSHVAS